MIRGGGTTGQCECSPPPLPWVCTHLYQWVTGVRARVQVNSSPLPTSLHLRHPIHLRQKSGTSGSRWTGTPFMSRAA